MTEPEEREYTCFWIVNVTGYSYEDAAQAAEDAMTDRNLGSIWHVVEGIVPQPEGTIEIDAWEVP